MTTEVRTAYQAIRERIAAAAERAGRRDAAEVQVVAVTKGFGPEAVLAAVAAGIGAVGENRVQEARDKRPLADAALSAAGRDRPAWHLIGPLQSNKLKLALELFDWIAALDSWPLAESMSQRLAAADRRLPVLIEIKTAPEAAKHGILPPQALDLVPRIARLPGLDVRGLMTIAPLAEPARPAFRSLAGLRTELAGYGVHLEHLSMGMSGDFEVAVEEGATMVRLGTALFGSRAARPASA
ncbi:MAG TPA: YggS family pyridoxal phosphate-dependent enzyme [Candidatus Udaeobacter sp.]|nr:YggS family pyridoxal phosphate-dependent enzyme [Candidatus Udaeobacter sp.]